MNRDGSSRDESAPFDAAEADSRQPTAPDVSAPGEAADPPTSADPRRNGSPAGGVPISVVPATTPIPGVKTSTASSVAAPSETAERIATPPYGHPQLQEPPAPSSQFRVSTGRTPASGTPTGYGNAGFVGEVIPPSSVRWGPNWVPPPGSNGGTPVESDEVYGAPPPDQGMPAMWPPGTRGSLVLRRSSTAPNFVLVSDSSMDGRRMIRSDEEAEPSLEDIVRRFIRVAAFLRRHALFLNVFAGLGMVMGIVSFYVMPPPRTAFCEVTLHPEPTVNPVDPDGRQQQESRQFFAGAERAFISREAIRTTLVGLGASADENAVDAIASHLKFESQGIHDYLGTLREGFFARNERDPVEFLDAHLKNYVESEIQKKIKVFVAEVDFLRKQTAAAEKELQDIAADTVKFRESHVDQLVGEATLSPESRSELESRRITLASQVRRLESEIAAIRAQAAGGGHEIKRQSAQSFRDALATVNRKLAEKRALGLADGHPEVRSLIEEKRNLENLVNEQLRRETTSQDRQLSATDENLRGKLDERLSELSAARGELASVIGSLHNLHNVSRNQPKIDARIEQLERQQEETKRLHGQLYERLRKAEVQLELERVSTTSRYEIAVPPRLERIGVKRTLLLRSAIGFALGGVLALFIVGLGNLRRLVAQVNAGAAVLLLVLTMAGGCAHESQFVWVQDLLAVPEPASPTIRPRDTILVEVAAQPSLSGEFVVRDDGHYLQPMVGSIQVADNTPAQVARSLEGRLKDLVVAPVVSVWIVRNTPIRVGVVGEVKTPGSYELTRDRSVMAALAAAGWLTEFAHDDRVFVVRKAGQDPRIRFRVCDLTEAESHAVGFRLADGDAVVVE